MGKSQNDAKTQKKNIDSCSLVYNLVAKREKERIEKPGNNTEYCAAILISLDVPKAFLLLSSNFLLLFIESYS